MILLNLPYKRGFDPLHCWMVIQHDHIGVSGPMADGFKDDRPFAPLAPAATLQGVGN